MNSDHLIIFGAIIVIIVLLVIIITKINHSSKKPSNLMYSMSTLDSSGSVWKNYLAWMQNYILQCVKAPVYVDMDLDSMPDFVALKKQMMDKYSMKYSKQSVQTFVAFFEHFVKFNIQNIKFTNQGTECEAPKFPDNGQTFATWFARMAQFKTQDQVNKVAAIWVQHATGVVDEYCALVSKNSSKAQEAYTRMSVVTQLDNLA